MQNFILYQPGSSNHSINECRYSLLRYLSVYNLKPPADIAIAIYTAKPAMFEAYAPFFNHFELIEKPVNNRLDVLNDFIKTNSGNVICCNTDCYLTAPMKPIFENINAETIYLFEQDELKNGDQFLALQKLKTYLSTSLIKINNQSVKYPDNIRFYTTQAIGINSSAASLMENIAELATKLSGSFPLDIAEKFAFASYLSNHQIQYLKGRFKHFGNLPEFKELLQVFFNRNEEESIPNLVKLIHHLDVETIINDKVRYLQLPFYKKWLNMLTGREWSIKKYQNKI